MFVTVKFLTGGRELEVNIRRILGISKLGRNENVSCKKRIMTCSIALEKWTHLQNRRVSESLRVRS
jgi:hypothetical protein